jgi:hypothetical protein
MNDRPEPRPPARWPASPRCPYPATAARTCSRAHDPDDEETPAPLWARLLLGAALAALIGL